MLIRGASLLSPVTAAIYDCWTTVQTKSSLSKIGTELELLPFAVHKITAKPVTRHSRVVCASMTDE